MGKGIDHFTASASTFNTSLKVGLGSGQDFATLSNSLVTGQTTVFGNTGHDEVTLNSDEYRRTYRWAWQKATTRCRLRATTMINDTVLSGGVGLNTFVDGTSNFYGRNNLLKKNLAGGR